MHVHDCIALNQVHDCIALNQVSGFVRDNMRNVSSSLAAAKGKMSAIGCIMPRIGCPTTLFPGKEVGGKREGGRVNCL